MLGEIFDPKAETLIYEHCRPHWSQAGAVVFITFRTHDSIPREDFLDTCQGMCLLKRPELATPLSI